METVRPFKLAECRDQACLDYAEAVKRRRNPPRVICHIMSSVDGRLLNARWSEPFGGTSATAFFEIYASIGRELGTDAWMFGKNTLRAVFPEKFEADGDGIAADAPSVFIGERRSARLFVIADPEGDIRYTSSTLRGDNMLVILGRNVKQGYLAHLRQMRISYVIVPDAANLRQGLETVGCAFGIRSVSVQGGGILNGALLAGGLMDELSLVVYPGIDGLSGVPSIFEYTGGKTTVPAEGQSLRLLSASQREYGVMWLRYSVHKKKQ